MLTIINLCAEPLAKVFHNAERRSIDDDLAGLAPANVVFDQLDHLGLFCKDRNIDNM